MNDIIRTHEIIETPQSYLIDLGFNIKLSQNFFEQLTLRLLNRFVALHITYNNPLTNAYCDIIVIKATMEREIL